MVTPTPRVFHLANIAVVVLSALPVLGGPIQASAPGGGKAKPLTLERSIQLALQNHPALAAAAAQLRGAQARATECRARRAHPLSFGVGTSLSRGCGGGNPDAGFGSLSVQAGYDLDLVGRRKLALREAQFGVKISRAERAATLRAVALAVVGAYYDVLRQQRAVAVAKQGLAQDQNQLQHAKALFKEQLVARLDIVKAQAQVARSQQRVVAATGQFTAARASFCSLLGLPMDSKVALSEAGPPAAREGTLEALQTRAAASSPEIHALDAQLAQADVALGRAARLRKPEVSIQVDHLLTSDPADYRNRTNLGLVISLSLDDWRAAPAARAQAQAHLEALQAQRRVQERQLKLTLLRQWLDLKSKQALVTAARKGVNLAEENVRLTRLGYDARVNTMKEVLDAQTELTRARAAYWDALYDADASAITLRILTGALPGEAPATQLQGAPR